MREDEVDDRIAAGWERGRDGVVVAVSGAI